MTLAERIRARIDQGRSIITLGRSSGDIDLSGELAAHVSQVHSRLLRIDGAWHVEDMNSMNGTRVNGIRLGRAELIRLRPDDRVSLVAKAPAEDVDVAFDVAPAGLGAEGVGGSAMASHAELAASARELRRRVRILREEQQALRRAVCSSLTALAAEARADAARCHGRGAAAAEPSGPVASALALEDTSAHVDDGAGLPPAGPDSDATPEQCEEDACSARRPRSEPRELGAPAPKRPKHGSPRAAAAAAPVEQPVPSSSRAGRSPLSQLKSRHPAPAGTPCTSPQPAPGAPTTVPRAGAAEGGTESRADGAAAAREAEAGALVASGPRGQARGGSDLGAEAGRLALTRAHGQACGAMPEAVSALVGSQLRRLFHKHGYFEGIVTHASLRDGKPEHDEASWLLHVRWNDDEEDTAPAQGVRKWKANYEKFHAPKTRSAERAPAEEAAHAALHASAAAAAARGTQRSDSPLVLVRATVAEVEISGGRGRGRGRGPDGAALNATGSQESPRACTPAAGGALAPVGMRATRSTPTAHSPVRSRAPSSRPTPGASPGGALATAAPLTFACSPRRAQRLSQQPSQPAQDDRCSLCREYGTLVLCDGCPMAFHPSCIEQRIEAGALVRTRAPHADTQGEWLCPACEGEEPGLVAALQDVRVRLPPWRGTPSKAHASLDSDEHGHHAAECLHSTAQLGAGDAQRLELFVEVAAELMRALEPADERARDAADARAVSRHPAELLRGVYTEFALSWLSRCEPALRTAAPDELAARLASEHENVGGAELPWLATKRALRADNARLRDQTDVYDEVAGGGGGGVGTRSQPQLGGGSQAHSIMHSGIIGHSQDAGLSSPARVLAAGRTPATAREKPRDTAANESPSPERNGLGRVRDMIGSAAACGSHGEDAEDAADGDGGPPDHDGSDQGPDGSALSEESELPSLSAESSDDDDGDNSDDSDYVQ